MEPSYETTDVLICGCGPTGAMLSAYLNRLDVPNIVLEKEADITTDPRGITLDEDGIRCLQGLGLYEQVFANIGCSVPQVQFVSGVHNKLNATPFMCIDTSSTAGITGHVGMICHKQPVLENHLRSRISGASSDLRSGCTLVSIREDDHWVYAIYFSASGEEHHIRSRFLVGADGKTGFTRKKYLEPKGIQLLWADQARYSETWVALNWKISLPTKETHPSFPLWRLGYSPEQVFGLFFPSEFRFLCNPQRPAVCGRFGLPSDRLWRFEFVVAASEDATEMATPPMIEKVVFPYLTHPGSRYGISDEVKFPADCIEVLRCRPFHFSARSCDKWALGRVILCGDAAHVFPPFGGQGIASGFRDAIALSWRLALACETSNIDPDNILKGWYRERKQQLEASLRSTVRNGDIVNTRDPTRIFIRDWGLWLLQSIPAFKRWIERGPRNDGPMQYRYEAGMAFMPSLGGGSCFPQTYCMGLGSAAERPLVRFTDDVIFANAKRGIFQIVVLASDFASVQQMKSELCGLDKICPRLVPAEASFFIRRQDVPLSLPMPQSNLQVFRTATAEEFEYSPLCLGRPAPREYREDAMWHGVRGRRFIIVRADRFVFAACNTRLELEQAATRLDVLFSI